MHVSKLVVVRVSPVSLTSGMLPKTERRRVVCAMKFRGRALASSVDNSCGRFRSARGVPSNKAALAVRLIGQWRRKCATVSSCSWQQGRVGLVYTMEMFRERHMSRYNLRENDVAGVVKVSSIVYMSHCAICVLCTIIRNFI